MVAEIWEVLVLVLVLVYSELSMKPDAAGTNRYKESRDPGSGGLGKSKISLPAAILGDKYQIVNMRT